MVSSTQSGQEVPLSKATVLRQLFSAGHVLHSVGVFDGFSALLTNRYPYDALWISGLGVSAAHGVPDASIVTMTENLAAARLCDAVSPLPVIADCDTGFGDVNNVTHMVREYERAGIAAVCIEDKLFPKRNSFTDGQTLASTSEFAAKLLAAKRAQATEDFMVIARIESLVAGESVDSALERARVYAGHGADAILIHSKAETPAEVTEFAKLFRAEHPVLPLIAIPTTYPDVTSEELAKSGISMVIYANQILRAFMRSADDVLSSIARESSSASVESDIATVPKLLELIRTGEIKDNDVWYAKAVARVRAGSNPG